VNQNLCFNQLAAFLNDDKDQLRSFPPLLVPSAVVEAMEVDDRTEDIAPAPGLLPKNALAPVMDAATSRVACTARPMLSKICLCVQEAINTGLVGSTVCCVPRTVSARAARADL